MPADPTSCLLRLDGVTKTFGALRALDEVSLDIAPGELFCLLGPSGCGKSTLLRLIAGFENADSGRVLLDGRDIAGTPPHLRPVNMMFQAYALFPHLTVAGNVGYGLKRAGLGRREMSARLGELLDLVRLDGLSARFPSQLSGGQRQRVALARALARRPRLLLLDEPLAALDRRLREATQAELKRIQRSLGTTFVVVTHDQGEAMAMADRVAIMEAGRIVELGTPRDVYERPNSLFAAAFLGDVNRIDGRVVASSGPVWRIATGLSDTPFEVSADARSMAPGDRVALVIRPERVTVAPGVGSTAASPAIPGTVVESSYAGASVSLRIRHASGTTLLASRPSASAATSLQPGDAVEFTLPSDALRLYPVADGPPLRLP